MRRGALVAGLLVCGAGTLAAQDGIYLGTLGSGPEFGLVFRVGRTTTFEPGVFVSFDRYDDTRDSSEFRGHQVAVGVAAQVVFTGNAATVTPVGALRVALGREWTHTESGFQFPGLSASAESDFPAWRYLAGGRAGAQVRVSERVVLAFEYGVQVQRIQGTYEETETYSDPNFPGSTSRQYRTQTELWNNFTITLRVFRSPRAGPAVPAVDVPGN